MIILPHDQIFLPFLGGYASFYNFCRLRVAFMRKKCNFAMQNITLSKIYYT